MYWTHNVIIWCMCNQWCNQWYMGYMVYDSYHLVIVHIAIERGHLWWAFLWKAWWFSMVMSRFTRRSLLAWWRTYHMIFIFSDFPEVVVDAVREALDEFTGRIWAVPNVSWLGTLPWSPRSFLEQGCPGYMTRTYQDPSTHPSGKENIHCA